ncbi:hypothetical protein WSK_2993 [Novosphingobium sp. Rr 2-17]|uniref:GNAT family N-acetyltransferase n=1 Tax=Novosphingobium sp. Rr 2-17 TaxID=555793 RepID=UPI000269A852|nr:GNAT family N-acetyltransferase [Novosphingobium sp. Rr 2-17]EIZ78430.1 hypothetical protein WSK_2993 [Novosphingobium sp. Rr 2-17]
MIAIIRPYRDPDLDAVTAIWLDSWRSTGISSPVTLEDLRERWPNELAKGWVVNVALRGPDMAGFIATHGNCIEQLFIAPAFQGQRIGKQLLDHAKLQMPAGFHLTTARNGRAGKFYQREGLTPGVETIHPRYGHRVIEYRWR